MSSTRPRSPMSLACVVGLSLISVAAFAQQLTPPPAPPDPLLEPTPKREPRWVTPPKAATDSHAGWSRTRSARILAELGGGLLGSGIGLGIGYAIGCGLSTNSAGLCNPGVYGWTMALGFAAGLSPGVWLAGEVAGADGSLGIALTGELIGGLLMIPAYLVLKPILFGDDIPADASRADYPEVVVTGARVAWALIPFATTIALYELSVTLRASPYAFTSAAGVIPIAGVSRDGAFTAGISGAF